MKPGGQEGNGEGNSNLVSMGKAWVSFDELKQEPEFPIFGTIDVASS